MAQFDVHRIDGELVIDCQADYLDLTTRLVVPLVSPEEWPPARRLNPVFVIEGEQYVMLTQAAVSVPAGKLGRVEQSFSDRSLDITNAFDMLIQGF